MKITFFTRCCSAFRTSGWPAYHHTRSSGNFGESAHRTAAPGRAGYCRITWLNTMLVNVTFSGLVGHTARTFIVRRAGPACRSGTTNTHVHRIPAA